jgi:membrane associated rhomboid family serine protease
MSEPVSPEPLGPRGPEPVDTWECYRHPGRKAGVRCRRCQRPLCPECMISAPVGFQCPSCVRGGPVVRSARSLRRDPYVTYTIIAACVAIFLPSIGGEGALGRSGNQLADDLALFGPAVADGEWWRLVSSGFLHYGLLHLGFNMFILWQLGMLLEPALGRIRFAALYFTALLCGSFGALLLSPDALTAGASGAVYGLMGAAVIGLRRRGVDPMQSGIGGLLVVNLLLTFVIPGISIGGHLGGLVGGALAGLALFGTEDGDAPARALGLGACGLIAAIAVGGSLAVA